MKQKVKLSTLQYVQGRDAEAPSTGSAGSVQRQESFLAKYRKHNRGAPATTPTEALLEELRKLYGEQEVQRDVFGRRIALPSEIARTLNSGRRK